MAKISVSGATKVAERRVEHESGTALVYVLCSDRRILRRLVFTDGRSDGYKLVGKVKADPTPELLDRLVERWHDLAVAS